MCVCAYNNTCRWLQSIGILLPQQVSHRSCSKCLTLAHVGKILPPMYYAVVPYLFEQAKKTGHMNFASLAYVVQMENTGVRTVTLREQGL